MESTTSTTITTSIASTIISLVQNNGSRLALGVGEGGGLMSGASEVEEDEVEWLNKRFVFFILLAVYMLVIVGGVLGNGSILLTLFTSLRVPRNPLLVVLCLSDFFVSGMSAPITVITSAFVQNSWRAGPRTCMTMYFLQYFPVASSTICHLMLSIDRYDTVKRPRVLHLRKKLLIPILVALFALTAAATVSIPFLFVHPSTSTTGTLPHTPQPPFVASNRISNGTAPPQSSSSSAAAATTSTTDRPSTSETETESPTTRTNFLNNSLSKAHQRVNRMCTTPENELVPGWYTPFILLHTVCVFILPGLGILMNHVRVRKKLCALSLTARAAHGELPLPMPLLRRQTHVIVVTGMANTNLTRGNVGRGGGGGGRKEKHKGGGAGGSGATGRAGGGAGAGNGSGAGSSKAGQRQVKRKPQSKRLGPHDKRRRQQPRDEEAANANELLDERPMIMSSSQHNNNLRATASNASNVQQNPEFPLPQTSTLIYRRRLANILMTSAFLFLVCWMPYTCAVFYYESKGRRSKIVTDLGLLIGYIYSALNPIIYFTLNHNSLRQSISCSLCSRLVSMRRFLRVSLGINNSPMAPPSSTNEAALGPFNPRYIKPKQFCKDKESSHFVY